MEFDIKALIIALLLGIISGLGFANIFGVDWWEELSSIGSLLGGLAAIFAAGVALKTLRRWRLEHDYVLAQKFLGEFEDSLFNAWEISKEISPICHENLEVYSSARYPTTIGYQLQVENGQKVERVKRRVAAEFSRTRSKFVKYKIILPNKELISGSVCEGKIFQVEWAIMKAFENLTKAKTKVTYQKYEDDFLNIETKIVDIVDDLRFGLKDIFDQTI